MPQQEMGKLGEGLPSLLLYSVVAFFMLVLLHEGKLPLLRLRRKSRLEEPLLFSGFEVLCVFLFWFLINIVASVVASEVVTAEPGAIVVASTFTAVATFAFLVHSVRAVAGQPLRSVGLVPTGWRNFPPAVALCFFTLFPLSLIQSLWMLGLHHGFGWEPRLQEMVNLFHDYVREEDVGAMSLVAFNAVLVAPVVEESLFRGLLFGWFRARCGTWGGAMLSSFIFALIHFTLSGFLPLLVLGLILAYLYQKTGSLYPPMLFHAVFNATTLCVILFQA